VPDADLLSAWLRRELRGGRLRLFIAASGAEHEGRRDERSRHPADPARCDAGSRIEPKSRIQTGLL
jgi:hypothetical protein